MRTALSDNRRVYAFFGKIGAPVLLFRSAQFWSGYCTIAAQNSLLRSEALLFVAAASSEWAMLSS